MNKRIILSAEAIRDIAGLKQYIRQELKIPGTAARYIRDLDATVRRLFVNAGITGSSKHIRTRFGNDAHRIVFKKLNIIFTVEDDSVYIKRIIVGSLPC